MGRIIETLQAPFRQAVEVVERSSSVKLHEGNVDEVDPPEDIDELYYDVYEGVGIVTANIDQYVHDVFEPGVRVEADSDATEAFFRDEFLPQCGVIGGEKRQPFDAFAPITETQRLTRGTALVNLIPNDRETAIPDTEVSGFYHIPPETVTPLVEEQKNILLPPDPDNLPGSLSRSDSGVHLTKRDEVAAYAQFEDRSIIGRRRGGVDKDTIYLSQTDVHKATYNIDIGGDGSDETGIWGQSALRPIKEEAAEYEEIKRDRATAIKTKAYGIWLAQFSAEVLDLPNNRAELREWNDDDIDSVMSELEGMSPGDVLELEGPIDVDQWESDVPDLDDTLRQLVDDILAPLPAPKYAVGFETDINQFVTEQQETRYEETVAAGRAYHEQFWTDVFETVAESHGLDASGLQVTIAPEESDNPITSMSSDDIAAMTDFMTALNEGLGKVPLDSVVDPQAFLQLTLDLPDDVFVSDAGDIDMDVDESAPEIQEMADELDMATQTNADV
jgi:hypothetical protein